MIIFYMKWKKYPVIQQTENPIHLKNQIMKNHPPSLVSALLLLIPLLMSAVSEDSIAFL